MATEVKLIATGAVSASDLTLTTASAGTNDTSPATTAFVQQEITGLIDSAPDAMNTLNELAAALGDDANFSTTVTNSIATKMPLAGGTMTGNLVIQNDGGNEQFVIKRQSAQNEQLILGFHSSDYGTIQAVEQGVAYRPLILNPNGGDVGIGTTSPSGNLHVVGASGNAGRIYLSDADNGTGASDSLLITKSGTSASIYNRDSGNLNLGTNNDNDMVVIDSSGDVGIGTTTPRTNLNVQSSVGASSYTGGGPGDLIRASGSGAGNWIASEDDGAMAYFGIDGGRGKFAAYNYTTSTEMHMILGQNRMFIKNDGRVGIGTTSPTFALDVQSSGSQVRIRETSTSGYGTLRVQAAGNTHGLEIDCFGTTSGGAYGVGSGGCAIMNVNSTPLAFGVGNSTDMTIDSSGRIFIGHQSADGNNDKLSISGSTGISVDGYIGAGSGYGPSNSAGSSSTIQLYSSSTGNMTFSTNYSTADEVHNMSGNTKFVVKRSAAGTEAIQLYTLDGGIRIGALNGSYHHFMRLSGPSLYYFDNPAQASGGFSTYSDERLKEEITTITGALDKVAIMNGVTFKWKDAAKRGGGDAGKQFGVLAQNMLEVDSELPKLNVDALETQENIDDDSKDTDYYSMDYSRITPFLIEAIKELKEKLETAEARITELEG